MKYKIAIASSDGKLVNQHFGKADTFHIIEADSENRTFTYLEERKIKPVCMGGEHDDNRLAQSAERFSDCQYILVSRIGIRAQAALQQKGIDAYELPGIISDSVDKLLSYIEIQQMIS